MTVCPSCAEPIPERARFCPSCGTATPVAVNAATGQVFAAPKAAPDEGADHRDRLQRALGDGLKIRRLLGRGGFAEVWAAFDVRLKREVAVKTLRYDLVISETLLQRFQREAEAVAKLRHPNIIPIYEVGEGEGIAYFVMPMIEGESLAEALEREERFSIEETCRILRESAGALAAAHRAGIVHRDIKPDNIMLEGPERRPIVMDFGIAKATTGGEAKLTGTGMAMGTPHYMSPEQASGDSHIDARSDQYALALVGYRMLAGALPFTADTMPSLILKQITEVPKPLVEVRGDVPHELSDVLARALSKDPAARFASMEEFAAAIPHVGGAGAGAASGARRRRPTVAELLRHPAAAAPALASPLVLGAIAGLALVLAAAFQARVSRTAVASRTDATFAGRAFLVKEGATAAYAERSTLQFNDTAYHWLRRSFGAARADSEALGGPSIYAWQLAWTRGDDQRTVGVSPTGQISAYRRRMADTAAAPSLTTDSTMKVAEAFLRDAGVDPATLRRVGDSTSTRANRTDRLLTWESTTPVVAGKDTAAMRYRVTVAGDQPQEYRAWLRLPRPYVKALSSSIRRNVVIGTVISVWALLVILTAVITIRRQRSDELQWSSAMRIGFVAMTLWGVAFVQQMFVNVNSSSAAAAAFGLVVVGLIVLFGLLFGLVAGESLANETNPRALLGFESLARLRGSSPEWRGVMTRGFAVGGIIAGIVAILRLAAIAAGWRSAGVPDGINERVPHLLPAETFGGEMILLIMLFFAVHVIVRFTKRPWLGYVLPAIAMAIMTYDSATQPLWMPAGRAVGHAVLCWAVWNYGFVIAAFAAWVAELLPAAVVLLLVGQGEYVWAGVVSVAVLAALLAFGLTRRAPVVAMTPPR